MLDHLAKWSDRRAPKVPSVASFKELGRSLPGRFRGRWRSGGACTDQTAPWAKAWGLAYFKEGHTLASVVHQSWATGAHIGEEFQRACFWVFSGVKPT